jgi:hypothetical protein
MWSLNMSLNLFSDWENSIQPVNMTLHPVSMILYKVLLTTVWTNEIAAIFRSYNKVICSLPVKVYF